MGRLVHSCEPRAMASNRPVARERVPESAASRRCRFERRPWQVMLPAVSDNSQYPGMHHYMICYDML